MFSPNQNPHHPKKGSSTRVEPITDLKAIKRIKLVLAEKPRDLCLFTLGINTAYRANELLSLTIEQVAHLNPGDQLVVKQSKNRKHRAVILNKVVIESIKAWLTVHPVQDSQAPLFISKRGGEALKVPALNALVKKWCREVGLKGNYGSHTLRKTWGYHQRVQKNTPVALLMSAFGHASEAQTLSYLCIQPQEIEALYELEL